MNLRLLAACALVGTFSLARPARAAPLGDSELQAIVVEECGRFGASADNRKECFQDTMAALLDPLVHARIGTKGSEREVNADAVLWEVLLGLPADGIFDNCRDATVKWQLQHLREAGAVDGVKKADGVVRKDSWNAMCTSVGEERMKLINALRVADEGVAQAALRQLAARIRERIKYASKKGWRAQGQSPEAVAA